MNVGLRASITSAISNEQQRIADFERLQHDAALYGYKVSSNVAYDAVPFLRNSD